MLGLRSCGKERGVVCKVGGRGEVACLNRIWNRMKGEY